METHSDYFYKAKFVYMYAIAFGAYIKHHIAQKKVQHATIFPGSFSVQFYPEAFTFLFEAYFDL